MFSHHITFFAVGIALSALGISRGKIGSIVGKVLYFAFYIGVAFILDIIATIFLG